MMNRVLAILSAVFFMLSVSACDADDFALTSYKTLESSAITYNMVMESAAEMKADGKMSDEAWGRLREAALTYYDSYQLAVSALSMYMGVVEAVGDAKPTQEKVSGLVKAVSEGITDLLTCAIELGVQLKTSVPAPTEPVEE